MRNDTRSRSFQAKNHIMNSGRSKYLFTKKTARNRTHLFMDEDREKRFEIRPPAKKESGTSTKIVGAMNATSETQDSEVKKIVEIC
ncbi:MAG: hypothetical protein RBR38_07750 [Desulfomicrobium apsheronum]|nr:hypothetical protein [Desulfomicrobium apsheronum]